MSDWLRHAGAGLAILLAAGTDADCRAAERSYKGDVRLVWQDVDAAWNARDVDGFSALFTVDALFAFMDRGERMEGQSAIHATFSRQFSAMSAELRHRTSLRDVRTVAPGVSAVDGRVDILRVSAAGAEPTPIRSFAMAAVMLHTAEGWRIRELHVHPRP